jgi:hypothetical protein
MDDGYGFLTGSLVNGERGIAFTKLDQQGNVVVQKKYRKDNYLCYEGGNNCMKYDSLHNTYYMCGVAITYDYSSRYPFIVEINQDLDTIFFDLIEVDSVYGAYNVFKQKDTLYAIVTQDIIPDDTEMGLLLYNTNGTVSWKCYGV